MGYRTLMGLPDGRGIFRQKPGLVDRLRRLPGLAAGLELHLRHVERDGRGVGVDVDRVAFLDQRQRTADGSLRRGLADAHAARGAGKAAVGQ